MQVTVKLFAFLRDRAGVSELDIDLLNNATIADATRALCERLPQLREHLARVAYAVNREYASADTELRDGDELALIPPVSGG